jgi:hypothetical protein
MVEELRRPILNHRDQTAARHSGQRQVKNTVNMREKKSILRKGGALALAKQIKVEERSSSLAGQHASAFLIGIF